MSESIGPARFEPAYMEPPSVESMLGRPSCKAVVHSHESSPDGWVHLVSPGHEVWLNMIAVKFFETPGTHGRPSGWLDEVACSANLGRGNCVGLNAEQWEQAKRIMGFAQ